MDISGIWDTVCENPANAIKTGAMVVAFAVIAYKGIRNPKFAKEAWKEPRYPGDW